MQLPSRRGLDGKGELPRRLQWVALGDAREFFWIADPEVTFHVIVEPGQAQDFETATAAREVGVTIESTVQQHVPRPDRESTGETRLDEGPGKDYGRIACGMAMTREIEAWRQLLDARSDRPVDVMRRHFARPW